MRRVHTRPSPAARPTPANEQARHTKNALASHGQPLHPSTRAPLETRFGHDFGKVAIHTDDSAARAAEATHAKAMAIGSDVFFADGRYDLTTPEGLELLHHELTHVVQNERNPGIDFATLPLVSHPGDASEGEATQAADQLGWGAESVSVGASPAASISCDPDDDAPAVAPAAAATGTTPAAGTESSGGGEGGVGGLLGTLAGVPHAAMEFVEGGKATTEVSEAAEPIASAWKGFEGMLGPLPGDIAAAAEGSPTVAQTAEQVSQAQGALGSGGASFGNALAPLALGSGLYESGKAIGDMSDKGANLENTPDLVKGALETTSGGIGTLGLLGAGLNAAGATGVGGSAVGAAAAAAPVGMVAGAGALGMLAGKEMGDLADSSYTKTGAFGTNEAGQNQSAMDWGANWGTNWDKAHGNTDPSVMGGVLAGAGGIVGGIGGAGYGAYNWLKGQL
jgi:hypothetical protein